jgi:predicted deacetylase
MQPPDVTARAVAIAVHDASPATWRECRELLAMLDAAGAPPVSLLVVPHYHYGAYVANDRSFVEAMHARLARGDELVLHG